MRPIHIQKKVKEFADKQEEKEHAEKNAVLLSNILKESKNNFILSFLDINKYPISMTARLNNQILVKFKNGQCELLPRGINGYEVKTYMGVQYTKVKQWSLLPIEQPKNVAQPLRGVYNCF